MGNEIFATKGIAMRTHEHLLEHFSKSATHHRTMADVHKKIAEAHESVAKAHADANPEAAAGHRDIGQFHSDLSQHHSARARHYAATHESLSGVEPELLDEHSDAGDVARVNEAELLKAIWGD